MYQAFVNVDGRAGYVIGIVPTVSEDQLRPSVPGYSNPWVEIRNSRAGPLWDRPYFFAFVRSSLPFLSNVSDAFFAQPTFRTLQNF